MNQLGIKRPGVAPAHSAAAKTLLALMVTLLAAVLCALPVPTAALADDLTAKAPEHHKTIADNGNGTYDLALSVIGDSEESTKGKPIDVVVVVDTSTSMNDVIADVWGSKSRMQAAHDAVGALASALLTQQNAALSANQQVQMSVVSFGTSASVSQGFTADANAVSEAVITTAPQGNGTNWEAGLKAANAQSTGRADAEKYIVFLSDGNPTFRDTRSVWFEWKNQHGCYGNGTTDDGYCYGFAKDEANRRDPSVKFYAVSVAKDASNMGKLASETNGTYLDGTTANNLSTAFAQIAQTITKSASYKDVKIVDKLSEYVAGTVADGSIDIQSVRYTKGGETWTEAPQATVGGDSLTWDLSSAGELERGVEYKVVFTVKPSQKAYDATAAAGKDLTFETNDDAGTLIAFKTIVKETGKEDRVSDELTSGYEMPTITLPYTAKAAELASFQVTKVLEGRAWNDDDSFAFVLEPQGSAPAPSDGQTKVSATKANQVAHFGSFVYDKAGTYTYKVSEVKGSEAGVEYDDHAATVTVTVVDNHKGKLLAEASVDGGVFTNVYTAAPVTVNGSEDLSFTKKLSGRDLKAGEFSFAISSEDGPLPAKMTATNAADGSFSFGDITFTKTGTYHYAVAEDTSNLPAGVTATTQGSKQVTITVTDDGQGHLVAKVAGPDDGVFANAYKPSDAVVEKIATTKIIKAEQDGVAAPKLNAGDFSFTMSSTNGGPLPAEATVANDAAGNISFGAITFAKDDLAGSMEKTFDYVVSESGNKPGVTNDADEHSFSITVKDNGDGTMSAVASELAGFVNTYSVKATSYSMNQDVQIGKSLTGRDLVDGEFEFELVEGDDVVATARNAADGSVKFPAVTYDKPGTHNYAVREVEGVKTGVEYDKNTYSIVVTVTDNGDGSLQAKAEASAPIVFRNTYVPEPASVSFSAKKVLDGADLKDGQFSFVLKDADGNELQTVKNAADGSVIFAPVELDEAGTYSYTVSEVNDGQAGVSYDDAARSIVVTVTDEDGQLIASVEGDGPEFRNSYVAPKPNEPVQPSEPTKPQGEQKAQQSEKGKWLPLPQTGDATNAALPVAIVVIVAVAVGVGVAAKAKKK